MFEYEIVTGAKVLINPKYITAVTSDRCNEGQCNIFTVDNFYIVKCDYDTVSKHYGNWLARCG